MSELALPGTLTETSLELPEGMGIEDWIQVGDTLKRMSKSIQWWAGDWLAYGEDHYGESAFQALERADKTLANWATVCRKVERSRRRDDLPFSQHAEVTSLPPEEQTEVLGMAAENGWTVRRTREEAESRRPDVGKTERVETRECPSCGADSKHWQRVPGGVE